MGLSFRNFQKKGEGGSAFFLKEGGVPKVGGLFFFSKRKGGMNYFHINPFHILEAGLLAILIDCMIILSPFLDVTRMSMSTVSFLAQLDSGILFLYNAFLSPMILVEFSLELTDIF